MPDTRNHRGPNPADAELFAPQKTPGLRLAVADYSLLLTKGYAETSALKLVGDRFGLTQRQRLAVMRCSCSDQNLANRKSRQIDISSVAGQSIAIDGYNLLITIEAAMSGGLIFLGRDGCCRDLASIHGTYRKVTETIPAIELIGNFLQQAGITRVLWLLDSPVSNSGRLKTLIREIAEKNNWQWQIELVTSPDAILIKSDSIVASSDSIILDGCKKWVNLAGEIVKTRIADAKIINIVTTP
ncbi:MAG: DUF434 domain-containing protein [Sedimentisphaerales bacterium]